MGHKKRNVAVSRSKPSPTAVVSGGAITNAEGCPPSSPDTEKILNSSNLPILEQKHQSKNETSSSVESDGSSYSVIKLECERALTALRRGNHTKALRLMKDLSVKHENSGYSALINRVQGTVCVKVASIIDDPASKQRHLKNAIESAKKSVSLSPNSIEFSHFYANLLYEASNEGKEYEDVVQECERALAIKNPVDPGTESLQDETQQKISTPEARIGHVQNELRSLIQKSNIASISTWMKNLGNGEEKFRLIPIRRVSEDPMELRLVQARRPNEIKKATKTPEERRKEIEVRVAAARLLQQKSESPQSQNDGDKSLDSSLGSGQKVGERRKSGNTRKNASSAERRDGVRSYWSSMTLDLKRELLEIRVSDLKAHFNSSKDGLPNQILTEALSFASANKSWKFWMCCRCSEKFTNSESYIQHIVQDHMGSLLPKLQSILPQNLENEWVDMLLNCSWKPLDIQAAVEILKNQSKSQAPEFLDEAYPRKDTGECKDFFEDSFCSENDWVSSPRKKKLEESCNGSTVESGECDTISDIARRECDGNQIYKTYFLPDSWPLSDDAERGKILERIHVIFEAFIKHKYLAASHVNKVIQFAGEELQSLASGSQLLSYGVDQTPLCICFLGAPELKKILKFLQELSHSCGIGRYSEKGNGMDDSKSAIQSAKITEKVFLNEDASCLLLDEHFLPCSITPSTCRDAATDDATAATSANASYHSEVVLDADSLLSWIFRGPTSGEQLASWTHMREEKANQGIEILQMLEKEFYHLQSLCERKCEHLSYEEALQGVEDLCLEESKTREHVTEFVRRSYESVLRKRREELIENDNDAMFISNRFELDAISNVLKEAESLNVNQFGFEETYNGVTSHLSDLESGEDDEWRTKDYLHQVDSCIEVAIQRQKEQVSIELSKIDARIMRNVTGMQQLEAKLDPASMHDYRAILVPLVKSYMRAHLEDLAEKDATEKSDAAREAFLAELALDSKKGSAGGSDSSRHIHEKTKDKRKNKEYRKTKDSKPAGNNGLHMLNHEVAEQNSPSVAYDGDLSDTEILVPGSDDALNQLEEEFRRRIELEAEERKLEETLAYQRRIEDEAKFKHLAEQHKKTAITVSEKEVSVGLPNANLKQGNDDQDEREKLKHYKQEPLTQKNGFINILEGLPRSTADGATQRTDSTHICYDTKVKQGIPNGGIPEDGVLSSDRRTGRRRRTKNTTKLIDGKYQPTPSEKENIEIGQVKPRDSLHVESSKFFPLSFHLFSLLVSKA
ncbi:unnamed protein product [Ilex paraguariensis]|uniref:C2H2-type domain-containing protein n=1 Tax=Ilex paraguariensis TaxID=185542 RepID=A0ABC8UUN5_9AQUA